MCHRRGSRKELSGKRTDRGRNSGKPHCGTDEAIPARENLSGYETERAMLWRALFFHQKTIAF